MFVKFRPARVRDLGECLGCLRDGFAYDDQGREALLEMWSELLASGAANGAVMEDVSEPLGRRIVFFCFKVFVGDEYVRFLKSEAGPMVGAQVLTAWLKGASPCLSASQIRKANSGGGVNILVLNSGLPERMWGSDQLRYLVDRIGEFSCYFTSGYRCKELLEEFYTDFEYQWAAGAGFRVRTRYGKFLDRRDLPEWDGREWAPVLYGVTAEEAAASAGTLASMMFGYQEPRFFFRRCEQELLVEALLGETDETLAASLGVAAVTVRKRWDSIYCRVAERAPELLSREAGGYGTSRVTEKKRLLLSYLRQHLEELRPAEAPGKAPEKDGLNTAAPRVFRLSKGQKIPVPPSR
ncbi:hypothetical protein CCAX7_55370 [Capsulimonas corticalis]|uniref:Uncharacterized protein n=1 Tax=Capsulimonas corticalis TaxID=2219043 RepID=A0A402D5J3_9BACT|nr:hypothetical protein [Capsulimonas corticalis]BDI33486.1 hypothetical protein CCAX7_55370 [Capsulimonas corticalis]